MNSRERVLAAVNHQKPDRVPIDLGAIRASGISAVVYDQMKKRAGINTPTKIHDTMQILAEIEMEMVDRLHVDVLPLDVVDAARARSPENHAAPGLDQAVDASLGFANTLVVAPGEVAHDVAQRSDAVREIRAGPDLLFRRPGVNGRELTMVGLFDIQHVKTHLREDAGQ